MDTTIYQEKTRFNMLGQKLDSELIKTEKHISKTIATKVLKHALSVCNDAGFVVSQWKVEIYTMDEDLPVKERGYTVKFINSKNGYIEVCGIHFGPNSMSVSYDYGLDIGVD